MQLNWQYSSSGLRLTWSDKWIDSHGLTFSKQSSRALADMKNTYPNGCKIFKVDWKPTLNNAQNKCTGKGQSCLIALGGACFRGFPGPALLVAAARFLPRCIQLPLSVGLINSLTDFCPTIKQLWQFDKQIRFNRLLSRRCTGCHIELSLSRKARRKRSFVSEMWLSASRLWTLCHFLFGNFLFGKAKN